MTGLTVPSIGAAMKAGHDSLIIDERQFTLPFRDVLRACAIIVAAYFVVLLVSQTLYVLLSVLTFLGATAIVLVVSGSRAVCLIAHGDYYVAIRSEAVRYRSSTEWDFDEMEGQVIAVLQKSTELRPEERSSPGLPPGMDTFIPIRDVFVFQNGNVNVLVRARMNEDVSIATLHRIKAFFERNSTPPSIRADEPAAASATADVAPPRRKGTAS